MDSADRNRILAAVEMWVRTKIDQQLASEVAGQAQQGTRAAVTGGRHLRGFNQLIVDELLALGLDGVSTHTDRAATLPGYYRPSKSWDLLVSVHNDPVLAVEYKSMTGSEGKNLNNRADEVIGAAQDLRRAQDHGLLPAQLKRGYVFVMEITPQVQRPVDVRVRGGEVDPAFIGATYLDRMAIMCQRLYEDGLYDMVWALGVTRNPIGLVEPSEAVSWDRFSGGLRNVLEEAW